MSLPPSGTVDVGAFSGLFSKTTNSYKYLFFLSLLDALERTYRTALPTALRIGLRELAVGMFANAWYPRVYFRLSFGSQDQVANLLDPIALNHPLAVTFDLHGKTRLSDHLRLHSDEQSLRNLLRYVVQRLLRVFFQSELRGVKDALVDRKILFLSQETFEVERPLYRLVEAASGEKLDGVLEVHPAWGHYLKENFPVVRGWAAWNWCQYMSSKNPNVPAVSEKLFPPAERASLNMQDEFWRGILDQQQITCIYTGETLRKGTYSLDHFLPWKFVLHDQLWNLIPVSSSANSSKSDSLPSLRYLDPFVETHCLGLTVARGRAGERKWKQVMESYCAGLRVPTESFDSGLEARFQQVLGPAFESTLPPLISLARQMGFSGDWVYERAV